MTQEQEQMVINHSPNYLGSQAFREALAFVCKHDKALYMSLVEMEYNDCKPAWDNAPKDFTDEVLKIEETMMENNIEDLETEGTYVSIHQEMECHGYERSVNRTGYIISAMLKYGDLVFWDSDDREEVKPDEITCGLDDVIKAFWEAYELKCEEEGNASM